MTRSYAWFLTLTLACTGGDDPKPTDTDDATPDTDTEDTDLSDEVTDLTDPPEDVTLRGLCEDAQRWGAFSVDANPEYAYASGTVTNGVIPLTILTEGVSAGGCTIWKRENPFCDGGCDPGETCSLSGTCVPYPVGQDVGAVTVDGLAQPVSMVARPPGNTYYDTSLPNPPWTPGERLTLHIEGGAWDPATLYGFAPETLIAESLEWYLTPGEPFSVSWTPAADGSRTEVVLGLRVDQHGLTPSQLRCVFPDTGSGTVPAEVLNELFALGLTGFPAGDLIRRTTDSAQIADGCVDFTASSTQVATLEIEGYTPCQLDRQCPRGQTCNEALERCE